LLELQLEVVSN
jgi:hypothetical protein